MALLRRNDPHPGAWHVAPWHECVGCEHPLRFDDADAAETWLRGFDVEELRRAALRCVDDAAGLQTRSDALLLRWLAGRIVARAVCVCDESPRVERMRGGGRRNGPIVANTPVTPSQLAGAAGEQEPLHWIQIELVDADDQPVPGEAYEIELPDGERRTGTLDERGLAYVGDIKTAGSCKVCFPSIDAKEWRAA